MRRNILLLTALFFLWLLPLQAHPDKTTLKDQMTWIHEHFGVNFIYDSSLDINAAYGGTPMSAVVGSMSPGMEEQMLEKCLETLFRGTGISWEIKRKYIVLTRGRKKPREYTVFIEQQHDTISESRITALIDRKRNATQTGLKKLDGPSFKASASPLAQPDLIKTLQQLPGVASGTEMLSGLHVHGGTGHDNLFLLDGVPLYQVSHLAGLFSSFNTEIIDHVDFYKSGFPSRYGGKLSSVVDVTTKEGDMHEYHGMFSMGLINGSLQLEGPIVPGKTSFNVAMRRSWLDVLTAPALAVLNRKVFAPEMKIDGRYALTDLNASVTHLFSKDNQLSLNFYTGRDLLDVGVENPTVEYWEGERFTGSSGFGFDMIWGNVLASLNWQYKVSETVHANVIGYFTRTGTRLGYEDFSWDFSQRSISELTTDESSASHLNDAGLKADLDWIPSGSHHLRFGGDVKLHAFAPSRRISAINSIDGNETVMAYDEVERKCLGGEMGLYVEDEMSFGSWFRTNVGLRYVLFGTEGKTYHAIEPRVALRFQCGPRAALKLSYTEMNQFVHQVCPTYLDVPLSLWMPSTAAVRPLHSRQLAAGFQMDLSHGMSLNVEGFCKTMDNIMEYMGINMFAAPIDDWEESFVSGKGRAYGAETELMWKTGNTEMSLAYTLSWNERLYEDYWPWWYPDRYDNRHKLNLMASHRFSGRFDVYAGWTWHSGNRMTVESHGFNGTDGSRDFIFSSPNNYSLPDYHRLDLGMNFRKTTKRGNESIWTLSIYNAYCRMNPIFAEVWADYEYDENGNYKETGRYEVNLISLIPVIPMCSYTLRF